MFNKSMKCIAGLASAALIGTVVLAAPSFADFKKSTPVGAALKLPRNGVTLNIVDVAGDLQIVQPMIESYMRHFPHRLAAVNFETGDATEIAGKLKAQEDAGKLQIDLLLTGNDALVPATEQGLLTKIFPDYNYQLGSSIYQYQDGAKKMFAQADGYAIVTDFGNYGPLLEYLPKSVANPPTTPAALLAWVKANPNGFTYGRPSNSGPGRAFVQGLPYILGDKDPLDPIKGWDKTWAYLKELGTYLPYYTTGTGKSMRELAAGTKKIVPSSAGWDVNVRAIGTVPKEAKVVAFENTTWMMDATYLAIPKGQTADKLAVALDLMKWILTPSQQANAFDDGYMYPGPAIKGVTIGMAPASSRKVIATYGRPEYAALLAKYPALPQLPGKALGAMFDKWDQEIGAAKLK
jgi:putative spermidine/putrescine transport system substrate-binding protein